MKIDCSFSREPSPADRIAGLEQSLLHFGGKFPPNRSHRCVSWFICDGKFRVHAINAVGRRRARIIEIEEVDSGERFHGSARKLERLFLSLGSSGESMHVALVGRTQTP